MAFPSPPWTLSGEAWLSTFRITSDDGPDSVRPSGIYAAAFVAYEPPGVLSYRELMVARLLDLGRRQIRITDIWVDSQPSLEGGRVLWAIPKQRATLGLVESRVGPVADTHFTAHIEGTTVATGSFRSAPALALVRVPFAGSISQPRDAATFPVITGWRGSAQPSVARASWDFHPDGPMGFLQGRRPLASFRLSGVRLRFG